jgi:AcrR family transcriptional regulator
MREPVSSRPQVSFGEHAYDPRRARIVEAMAQVVYEHGYAGASVSAVCACAKVSRRTFFEAFETLEDCFLSVLDEGAARVYALISGAVEREPVWVDGVRAALAELLAYFDSEPVFAYVLLVEAGTPGARARERREQHLTSLTDILETRYGTHGETDSNPLVVAGVMAALLGVLHSELVAGRKESLLNLLGALMGIATAPFLDRRRVASEVARANSLACDLLASGDAGPLIASGNIEIPELLSNPRAYRARACIAYVAENPRASNREIGDAAGIGSHTQTSKVLAHLARIGVLDKCSSSPGGPNAWSLTPYGCEVTRVISGGKY